MNEIDMIKDEQIPLQNHTEEYKKLHEELKLLPQCLSCQGQKHKKLCMFIDINNYIHNKGVSL